MKKWTLLLAGVLCAFASYSQTVPSGFHFDGADWPIGNRGYAPDGTTEIDLLENIDPETNNLYPNNPTPSPDRECVFDCASGDGLSNKGDMGEFNGVAIHIGEDWNYGSGDDDAGFEVYASANGQVVDILLVNGNGPDVFGWMVVLKHFWPNGSYFLTTYKHVTTADSINGGICTTSDAFTVNIGDWVHRGDVIARIATGFLNPTYATHLHFELRDTAFVYTTGGTLYSRDNGRQSYGGFVDCITPCLNSGIHFGGYMDSSHVAIAYANAMRDKFLDPSDFINTHRPSFYAETSCYDPPIVWQNTIGGSGTDRLYSMDVTTDGGYILAGSSTSNISGDKAENIVGGTPYSDYWVVKLDSLGNIEWQNTIGGDNYEEATSVEQTNDGGYIVGGHSDSGIFGDKTENPVGYIDYWIIKLDNSGNIEWQNTIGGDNDDYCSIVRETSDGGYIVGGYSDSGIFGDKSEMSLGYSFDCWIIKLDNSGNIEWQNTIGGSSDEWLYSLDVTSDGGYILGWNSMSNISGDKTENNIGACNYWVVKLDTEGSIEWDNTIGGSIYDEIWDIKQTDDGGYILGGRSTSSISGDKTEDVIGGGFLYPDYWVVKLTSSGVVEWDNTIGGTSSDILSKLVQDADGGFTLSGFSTSGISGDKTENYVSVAGSDYWLVKLDNSGNIEWQNTIGGGDYDDASTLLQGLDGNYIIGGSSNSSIYGDKTEASQGNYDYWIVNFSCEVPCDPETIAISASGPTTFCQGGSVTLNATYSGATVQWKKDGTDILGATSSIYTVNQKGTYTATTTGDCGSTNSNDIVVVVQKNPVAGIVAGGPTTFCSGGSVVLTANAGAGLSYQWYKGATPIAGATGINYTATLAGNYRCQVTKVSTGCSKLSTTITVSLPCKTDLSEMNDMVVYPNPTSDVFYVQTDESVCTVFVANIVGQIVYQNPVYQNEAISVHGWPSGIYLVTLSSNQGTKTIQTVVE